MHNLLALSFLFLLFLVDVNSLICETCDGQTCFDRDRWIPEICEPSTQYCYRRAINGKAYRRGCSDTPCSSMPGVTPDTECSTCSQDRCNKEPDSFYRQKGGGISWKSSSVQYTPFVSTVFIVISYCLI